MEALGINIFNIIIYIILFIVLYFVLDKYLLKSMMKMLAKRQQDLKGLQSQKETMQKSEAELNTKHGELKTEVKKENQEAFDKIIKEAKEEKAKILADARVEAEQINAFTQLLKQGKNIGILSEAGCTGIADPGQLLVAAAQEMGAQVKP